MTETLKEKVAGLLALHKPHEIVTEVRAQTKAKQALAATDLRRQLDDLQKKAKAAGVSLRPRGPRAKKAEAGA